MDKLSVIEMMLSSAVIADLIAGIFSLRISLKTHKELENIEHIKQQYELTKIRYEQLNSYYKELIISLEKFEYKGKIEQSMSCMKEMVLLRFQMYEYIKKQHEQHTYYFSKKYNEKIIEKEKTIDAVFGEFIQKCKEADSIDYTNCLVDYMITINKEMELFKSFYIEKLKLEMNSILEVPN